MFLILYKIREAESVILIYDRLNEQKQENIKVKNVHI